jgi:hypothetical protein
MRSDSFRDEWKVCVGSRFKKFLNFEALVLVSWKKNVDIDSINLGIGNLQTIACCI